MLAVGAVVQGTGFFLITALLRPAGEVTAAILTWWAAAIALLFAAAGLGIGVALRKDDRPMEVVVGSAIGMIVPGIIGWIVVGSMPEFADQSSWRVLITILGATAGVIFWSGVMSYFGGRVAERLLGLSSE